MHQLIEFILLAVIGVFAGFLSGLLGIGGGLVTVPALLYMFHLLDFSSAYRMQIAVGTSLAAMVFTSLSSAWAHSLQKGVHWHLFRYLGPGIAVGAILGAMIADRLPSETLKLIFGVSVCLFGFYFLVVKKRGEIEGNDRSTPHPLILAVVSVVIGTFSAILGIGGGVFIVPFLTVYHTPLKNAISTSAVAGLIVAFIGALSFLYLGLDKATYHESLGYLYLPAFLILGITSSLTAPYGAALVYSLPTTILRRIFGVFLIIVGISMI